MIPDIPASPPPPLPKRLPVELRPLPPPEAGEPDAPKAETTAAALRLLPPADVAVSFFYDVPSGHFVFRAEDPFSGSVVRQIPSEEALRLYASLREAGIGTACVDC